MRLSVCLCAVLLLVIALNAGSPELSTVLPTGGQRGTDVTFTFSGRRLSEPQAVLFYRAGLVVKKLEAAGKDAVKATMAIAPDCPLGEHPVRLRTASGISELATIWVGALPVVEEKEPNSEFVASQTVPLNSTVAGVVKSEDVDYYRVEAKKGQRLCVEIEAMRLGRTMFDATVAILDAKRFELAASDDSSLLLQDPVACAVAPADGSYVIQVREASFGGSDACRYRLHVGTFPRPKVVYPAGGPAGEKLDVTFLGDVTGPIPHAIELPREATEIFPIFALQGGESAPSPNAFRVSAMPNVLEKEPNANRGQATVAEAPLPVALNGIIGQEGDHDWFRFTAKKGQTFDIEVFARRLRSPLDSVLNVFDGTGKSLAGNDDSRGPDSYLRFKAGADGSYFLRIRDHLGRGGAVYVYRVEFLPVAPDLTVEIPQLNRNRPQDRQTLSIPQGNRAGMLLRVRRTNVGGEVVVEVPEAPAGVTLHADTLAAGIDTLPVVLEAGADAALDGKLVPIAARLNKPDSTVAGGLIHTIPLVRGNPNNTVYYGTQVNRLAVAVTEPVPFTLKIKEPKVPIVQNGSMELIVVAERRDGFNGPIQLSMLWNPPGITSSPRIRIEKGKQEARYPLNAARNAPVRSWKIAVVGFAAVKGGPVWTSTQLATLGVAAPYVSGSLAMAAVERGQATDVVLTLEQNRAFPGTASLKLNGLPAKTSTTAAQVSAAMKLHTFAVKTAADAPPGTHKSLFCELVVVDQGEPIVHRFGHGGVLRIDRPRPAKVAAKKAKPKPKPKPKPTKAKPAAKPLSRLEQLRRDREQKLAGEEK